MDKYSITLLPTKEVVWIDGSKALGPSLKSLGYPIQSGCAGYGYCADCMVPILEGAEHLEPPTYDERRMLGFLFHDRRYLASQPVRLACQVQVKGALTIDISHHLEMEKTRPKASDQGSTLAFFPLASLKRTRQ